MPIGGAIAMRPATPAPPPFRPRRARLAYHLLIALAVKIVLLALLWHVFIKPQRVRVDVGMMSERIAGSASRASIPTSPGDNK
jgi:hypothetical protein